MKITRFAFLPLTAAILAGCASTSHNITLLKDDQIATQQNEAATSTTRIVALETSIPTQFGRIETGIGERANLNLINSPELAIANELKKQLSTQGISATVHTEPQTKTDQFHLITIKVDTLDYQTTTDKLKTIANIKLHIVANVTGGSTTYTGNYESSLKDEYGSLPDDFEVEATLDDMVRSTVTRIVNDPNVQILLKRPTKS